MLSLLISCAADHVPSRGLLLDLLGRSLRVNFVDRVGCGFCLGLGCRELRVFPSFRCLLGLRGLGLGCGRLFRTPGGFSFPSLAGCFVLCLGRLGLRLLDLDWLALGCLLCRCCLVCSGRRALLLTLGSFGCCCLLSFFGLAPVGEVGLLLSRGSLSINFLDRVGCGFCLGLGCRELRVFPSFRCLLGLRGLELGCGRLFRTPGGFSFPSLAGCFVLCLGPPGASSP